MKTILLLTLLLAGLSARPQNLTVNVTPGGTNWFKVTNYIVSPKGMKFVLLDQEQMLAVYHTAGLTLTNKLAFGYGVDRVICVPPQNQPLPAFVFTSAGFSNVSGIVQFKRK